MLSRSRSTPNSTNAAVLRHPARRFPGVLIQGDTLWSCATKPTLPVQTVGNQWTPSRPLENPAQVRTRPDPGAGVLCSARWRSDAGSAASSRRTQPVRQTRGAGGRADAVPQGVATPHHGARCTEPASLREAVLATLRDKLRSGDIWVERSSSYRQFDSYLLPSSAVPSSAAELGLPATAD